jgi:branched-chain amino acid transport system substrate-binding protein
VGLVRRRLPAAIIAGSAALAVVIAGCGSSGGGGTSGSSSGEIKIGAIYDLTGTLSALGVPEAKGAEAYFNELNAKGGINGRKVDLIVENGQSTTDAAVADARSLIQQGVVALLGPPSGATALSVLPIVDAAKIPDISHEGSFIPSGSSYMFTNTLAGPNTITAFAQYMRAHNATKVGLLVSSDANGQALFAAAKAIFPKNGVTIAAQETIDPTGTDFTTQMSELKAAKVDSVMTLVSGAANIIVAKDFQALNMPGNIYLLNASLSQLPAFGAAGPKIITPEPKVAVASQVATNDPFTPMINSFVAAVKGKGVSIDLFGTEGYDAAMILTAVIKAVGPNSAKIYNKLNNGFTDNQSLAGAIHWTPTNHGCCALNAWVAASVVNGHFKVIGPF